MTRPRMLWRFSIEAAPAWVAGLWLATVAMASAAAEPAGTADGGAAAALFQAYTNAFYVVDGSNAWFKADQTGGHADFWEQAEEIETVIDLTTRSPAVGGRGMVARLLDGFTALHGANWQANIYNDDCFWACLAFARGYLVTGEPRFKAIARDNFDRVYARAWDGALGGGLYWTTANQTKNACVNGPGGLAACLLFRLDRRPGDLAKARQIYAWERSALFDEHTGAVSDGLDTRGRLNHWASTYNQGTFIGLANELGRVTDARRAADFTRDHLTRGGLLPEYGAGGNNSGFNAIFIRWLARFMEERGLTTRYEPWLRDNARAAWLVRRPADQLAWCEWSHATPSSHVLRSWDCVASLEAVQFLAGATASAAAHQ